jgi:hypothetical protein
VLVVAREPAHPTDDRSAPRIEGVVDVRWRLADHDGARWLAGGPDPGPFVAFRGAADVSLSGIRFDCTGHAPDLGASVLVDLGLDGRNRHRALGTVRRVEPVGDRVLVAMEFLDLPETTFDALSDFTLRNL